MFLSEWKRKLWSLERNHACLKQLSCLYNISYFVVELSLLVCLPTHTHMNENPSLPLCYCIIISLYENDDDDDSIIQQQHRNERVKHLIEDIQCIHSCMHIYYAWHVGKVVERELLVRRCMMWCDESDARSNKLGNEWDCWEGGRARERDWMEQRNRLRKKLDKKKEKRKLLYKYIAHNQHIPILWHLPSVW